MTNETTYAPTPEAEPAPAPQEQKSFLVAWLLSLFLGMLGVDRFYLGKIGTGILKLITLGGFGIWTLIDLIMILAGATRDKRGLPLAGHTSKVKMVAWIVTGVYVVITSISGFFTGQMVTAQLEEALQSQVPIEQTIEDPAAEAGTEGGAEAGTDGAAQVDAATWAGEVFGTFEPITESGSGDAVIDVPMPVGIVEADYSGSEYFAIDVLDAQGASNDEIIVNSTGAYQGTTMWGSGNVEPAQLQIVADGEWTVELKPMNAAPALAYAGSGDGVFLYDGDAVSVAAEHQGERNFLLFEMNGGPTGGAMLANEMGAFSGTVPLSAGPGIVVLMADGAWTLDAQ